MISDALSINWLVRLTAPWVWRSNERIAHKLEGFAATEAGSALDMLKAAELTEDRKLRRLFFRHAMDEARHAQMFRAAARKLLPNGAHAQSEYNLIHATRQNLLEQLGLTRFIAFIYLAERRGESQFRALRQHFRGQRDMEQLFAKIGKDERFHVAYSRALLARLRKQGSAGEVRWALASIRFTRASTAWRRAGRQIGDLMTRILLGLVYLVVLPIFVVAHRRTGRSNSGWQVARRDLASVDSARRQY